MLCGSSQGTRETPYLLVYYARPEFEPIRGQLFMKYLREKKWISIHKLSCLAVGPVLSLSRNKAKASRPDLAIAFSPFASRLA